MKARFAPGQLIHHRRFDYRGVIFDVDPEFSGTDDWYEQVASTRPPKDAPWYHVLVHGATHSTYVAERNLEADPDAGPVDHPRVNELFGAFDDGLYRPRRTVN